MCSHTAVVISNVAHHCICLRQLLMMFEVNRIVQSTTCLSAERHCLSACLKTNVMLHVNNTIYVCCIHGLHYMTRGVCGHSGVPRNFFGGGVQQIQLRTDDRENGDLGAVAH